MNQCENDQRETSSYRGVVDGGIKRNVPKKFVVGLEVAGRTSGESKHLPNLASLSIGFDTTVHGYGWGYSIVKCLLYLRRYRQDTLSSSGERCG